MPLNKCTDNCNLRRLDGRQTNMSQRSRIKKQETVNPPRNPYAMGINLGGWGYPPSQTPAFSSCLPGTTVDVTLSSGSATAV